MWIRLTMEGNQPILVNLDTYGTILQHARNPTGAILYQTDAGNDHGLAVLESFEHIAAEIDDKREVEQ